MAQNKLICSFQLNKKDFFHYNYAVNRRRIVFMYVYGFILMVSVVWFEMMKEAINIIPILLGVIIIVLTFGATFYYMAKKSSEGWEANPVYHDPMKMEFDKKGFVCMTKNNRANILWKNVDKVIVSKKVLVILSGNAQAYIIPAGAANFNKAREMIMQNHIHKKKLFRRQVK